MAAKRCKKGAFRNAPRSSPAGNAARDAWQGAPARRTHGNAAKRPEEHTGATGAPLRSTQDNAAAARPREGTDLGTSLFAALQRLQRQQPFTRAATAATCWWTRASPARAWWPNCARSASIRRSSPACSSPTNTSTTYAAGGVLSRKYDLPVFATEGTWASMEDKLGGVALKNVRVLEPLQDFYLGGYERHGLRHPPRRRPTRGATRSRWAGRASPWRRISAAVRESWLGVVSGSDAVVLESNYDPDMLRAGPYPYALKQRILGRRGHLANDDAGARRRGAGQGRGQADRARATSARKTTSPRWRRRVAPWRWRARACAWARTPPSAWPSGTASPACFPCRCASDVRAARVCFT